MAGGRIFVSYRREESLGHAGRLYHLTNHFGAEQIFRDVDTIGIGEDFVEAIQRAVSSCDVLLAVIGKKWSSITDSQGRRRLDLPDDYVRVEIATALERNIRVVPVLVDGATPPTAEELPRDISRLARRNAIELSDSRFQYDVSRLIGALESTNRKTRTTEQPSPPKFVFYLPSLDWRRGTTRTICAQAVPILGILVCFLFFLSGGFSYAAMALPSFLLLLCFALGRYAHTQLKHVEPALARYDFGTAMAATKQARLWSYVALGLAGSIILFFCITLSVLVAERR